MKKEADSGKKPVTQPWRPASLLEVRNLDKNFRYRWVRSESVEKKLLEGWEFVNSGKSGPEAPMVTLMDGTKVTSIIKKRNLILMRMPEDLAKAREEYHKNLVKSATAAPIEEFKKAASLGGHYGEVIIGRR